MKNNVKVVTKGNKGIKVNKEAKQEEVKASIKEAKAKVEKVVDTKQKEYLDKLNANNATSRTLKKVTYSNALKSYELCKGVIEERGLTLDNVKGEMQKVFDEGKILNKNREGECPIHRVEFTFAVLCSIATNRIDASSTLMQSITEISKLQNRDIIKSIFPDFDENILEITRKATYKFA